MNSRPEITAMLSLSIQRHICPNNDPRIYWAREVTFDYATTNAVRVDFMKFKPVNNTVSGIEKGDFYCYDISSLITPLRAEINYIISTFDDIHVMLDDYDTMSTTNQCVKGVQ